MNVVRMIALLAKSLLDKLLTFLELLHAPFMQMVSVSKKY